MLFEAFSRDEKECIEVLAENILADKGVAKKGLDYKYRSYMRH